VGSTIVMSYLPQTVAREKRDRESHDLELRSLKIAADTALRADAVIERERQVKAQADAAQAIMSGAIHRFADDVLKLSHRLDQIEQRKIADALRELPDPDGVAPDDGDLEVPSHRRPKPRSCLATRTQVTCLRGSWLARRHRWALTRR
jgi:hypothetical protein